MDWFAGQTAVVTGAAHGIGRGVAELLAALGAHVIAVDKDESGLEEAFADERFIRVRGDLGAAGTDLLAEEIWRSHGPVHLLVNNVGIDTPHDFHEMGEAEFDLVFHTNLRGPWFFTQQITSRLMAEQRPGAVVFVSSLHDTFVRTRPHYSASKAGVGMLVRELASQLGPHGIRVNAVSPGIVRSAGNRFETPRNEAPSAKLVPMGRIGEPADVARVVAVLLSEQWSGYVTGVNVPVDGGLALHSWSAGPNGSGGGPGRRGVTWVKRRIGSR
jgi:NAD(P)-dependent dehydrogenase (short-subunit alcohol dehydrogenase family)